MAIVLASQSPRRQELLARIGVEDFKTLSLDIDESYPEGLSPEDTVRYIAKKKCDAAAALCSPDDLIITAGNDIGISACQLFIQLFQRILCKQKIRILLSFVTQRLMNGPCIPHHNLRCICKAFIGRQINSEIFFHHFHLIMAEAQRDSRHQKHRNDSNQQKCNNQTIFQLHTAPSMFNEIIIAQQLRFHYKQLT